MNHSEAGKGSKQRPTNQQKYAAQYDKIFGVKTHQRTSPAPQVPAEQVGDKKHAKKQ